MKNLSIVQKIILGFTLVLLLFAVCLTFSMIGMKNSTAAFEELIDSNFIAARQISVSQAAQLQARKAEKDLMYADDPLLIEDSKKKMQLSYDSLARAETALRTKEMPEMQKVIAELLTLNQEYQSAFANMITKPTGTDRAVALLPVRKAGNAMEELTGNALKLIDEDIVSQTNSIENEVASNFGLVLAGAAVALITGVFVVFLIIKAISAPLVHIRNVIASVQKSGDLSLRVGSSGQDEIAQAAKAFDSLMAELSTALSEVRQSTQTLVASVEQVAEHGILVQQGSISQRAKADAVHRILDEAVRSVEDSANNTREADSVANKANEQVEDALVSMRSSVGNVTQVAHLIHETGEYISQLNASSTEIGGIVNVIKNIADQTNLLALNAAIEAARAGEQGRGFAVVADEVRKLAENTSKATAEIAGLISVIQQQIQNSVGMTDKANNYTAESKQWVEQTQENLIEVSSASKALFERLGGINDGLGAQRQSMASVVHQINDISKEIDNNAFAADQAAKLSNEMANLSKHLQTAISRFKVA